MQWTTKARIQRAFSTVPGGQHLNHLMQRYVTHSLPRSEGVMREVADSAERHLDAVRPHLSGPLGSARFLEFGAGYELGMALSFASLGVRHQALYDLTRLARPPLVFAAAETLRTLGCDLPSPEGADLDGYLGGLGIDYRAPADARRTGLDAGTVDVVTSTSVLEHIPAEDIEQILVELDRVLAPGGVCSFAIDYHDHFAGSDGSLSPINFLRFTDDEWRRWNCSLQYQNRLRYQDFVELFERSPLETVTALPVVDDRIPADPPVAERFQGRPDLQVGDGWFVLRKAA